MSRPVVWVLLLLQLLAFVANADRLGISGPSRSLETWYDDDQFGGKGKGKGGKGKGGGKGGRGKGGKGKGGKGGKGKGGKGREGEGKRRDGSEKSDLPGSFRCTARGTTHTPRYSWCPEGTFVPNCEAIAMGLVESSSNVETYVVEFGLDIDGDVATTLDRVEQFLQEYVATDLAGCGDTFVQAGKATVESVTFDIVEDTESDSHCDTCTNADVTTDIHYSGSDSSLLESALLQAFLDRCDEISDIHGVTDAYDPCPTIQITKVESGSDGEDDDEEGGAIVPVDEGDDDGSDDGIDDGDDDGDEEGLDTDGDGYGVGDGDGSGNESGESDGEEGAGADGSNGTGADGTDGTGSGADGASPGLDTNGNDDVPVQVETNQSSERGMETGGKLGVSLAGLLLLLLLLLCCRRRWRRANNSLQHKQLGTGEHDTTFISDMDTLAQMPKGYTDDDSAAGGSRFGMYPQGQTENMILGARSMHQDVHKCSSATCKLCEARRQGGLQFLPIKGPIKVPNLTFSMREYESEDTVNL